LCLLCVTVATSFTFFTARHLDRWEGAWVASRGDVLDKDLAELDANRRDVVRLAAIEDAVDSLPERARAELRALAAEVEQYPAGERRDVREAREAAELNRAIIDRTEALIAETRPSGKPRAEPAPVAAHGPDRELMWERVTEELASGVQITAMTERASTGTAVLEQVPGDPNERSHRQAIERLQAQRSGAPGAPPRFTDLDVLGVERTRARAAREEAYHSTKLVVLSALIPRDGLADLFIQHMLTRIDVKPGAFTGFVDRRRARGAMNQRPPATWHPEIGTALGAARPARGSLVTGVEQRVTTARGRAATDRAQEIERTASSNARAYHEQQLPKRRGGKFGEPEEATERESESLRDIREPHVP
jgi:hypothetical protein